MTAVNSARTGLPRPPEATADAVLLATTSTPRQRRPPPPAATPRISSSETLSADSGCFFAQSKLVLSNHRASATGQAL